MTRVERLARQIKQECHLIADDGRDQRLVIDGYRLHEIARWVLRRERRARGRTVGWAVVNKKAHGPKRCCGVVYQTRMVADTGWRQSWRGGQLARCVLVPRRGGK